MKISSLSPPPAGPGLGSASVSFPSKPNNGLPMGLSSDSMAGRPEVIKLGSKFVLKFKNHIQEYSPIAKVIKNKELKILMEIFKKCLSG